MSNSPQRDLPQRDVTVLGMPFALVRELSAATLAFLVLLATFRISRSPLVALPIAGLVYWGVRSWIERVALSESSQIGRHAARLREIASGLSRAAADAGATATPSQSHAASRLGELAEELERLERALESHDGEAAEAEFFVDVQLPQAMDLVERYAELVETPQPGERTQTELRATEETFDLLLNAVREQVRRFTEHDLHEFAVDRRAFEEILRLDGVESEAPSAADFRSETA